MSEANQNNHQNLEIERKYLISMINPETLLKHYKSDLKVSAITQTYLIAEDGERRVRKRVTDDIVEFFYTEKFTISGLKRVENEREITEAEYNAFLVEADPSLHSIEKTRYTFDHLGQTVEIDIYTFSNNLATLEVELPSEDTQVLLPEFIEVIRDVTDDKAYKNKSLAKTQSL